MWLFDEKDGRWIKIYKVLAIVFSAICIIGGLLYNKVKFFQYFLEVISYMVKMDEYISDEPVTWVGYGLISFLKSMLITQCLTNLHSIRVSLEGRNNEHEEERHIRR